MNEYAVDILRLAGQGYCCTQIVLQLALELQGRENPGLIRAVSALCHGFPNTDGACGALSGAACLLGLYAGKGGPDEEEHERLPLMLAELSEWFRGYSAQRSIGIICSEIVGDGKPDTTVCGSLISDCYGQAMTILVENGFDPTGSDAN
jgi:hypothetical protein